ncbi:1-deoxy-D-xylulose-5-phosphate synthase [Candidatus Omnitrophus magneticus]|uniref:1-deoxy-D-xylulose-5-phosphate synthase n=1 Tax=Candidatus Omnitrophus magneticus TaxID=1609969 RepID=A0A0F0CNE0_9BACT|nr:1-deoxy-D-xylulose-5-phosphate synthase [Candidatus Omnitrophus magneticus]
MGNIMENKYLNKIKGPEDIKDFEISALEILAGEIREKIIETTSQNGGHIAASLGTVELSIALHKCLKSPSDKIIWDVGHQSYAHKLLTGRVKSFDTLREMGGISGFPNKDESEHDHFTAGHSGTSISSALGLATARDLNGEDYKVVAVIGDASLTTGLALEGLNHAGHLGSNLIVILNDNEHAISRPVGAISRYLNKIITNRFYNKIKDEYEKVIKNIPKVGETAFKAVRKFQESIKSMLVPGILFEEFGFRYFGPINGHDINQLISIFNNTFSLKEPVLIHVITKKGKGYTPSELDPIKFHGVSSFDIESGNFLTCDSNDKTFTEHFGEKIVSLSEKNEKIVAITAAMKDGVGLDKFADKFPARFFDVGITEEHAVTFAAGLAKGGFRPIVAIYSTFLQRSFDQMIHDVALQNLPVIFCLDRAGLVGKDGPTHHGVFDIAYTRVLPNFIVMAPKDGIELEMMMASSLKWNNPVVIRYPRDNARPYKEKTALNPIELGKSEWLKKGKDAAIIAVGNMVNTALEISNILSKEGIELGVINARFIKPLDLAMLEEVSSGTQYIITMEEGVISGGFGSAVLEAIEEENIENVNVKCLALPNKFIEHGSREELLRKYHMTAVEIVSFIKMERMFNGAKR